MENAKSKDVSSRKKRLVLVQSSFPAMARRIPAYPLNLMTLASYLRENEPRLDVRIYDAQINDDTPDEAAKNILSLSPDYVGLTSWTCQAPYVEKLSDILRENDPSLRMIWGGVHATMCTQEALKFCDIATLGEAEDTLLDIMRNEIEGKDIHNVAGIAYSKDGAILYTDPRKLLQNLDHVPIPAWDLVDLERYMFPLHLCGWKAIPIIGARGCPHSCDFCSSPVFWKRKVRYMSPKRVVDEMETASKRYGINAFHFFDDNFLLNKKYARGVCEEILQRGLDFRWVIPSRSADVVNSESLLPLLKKAGCLSVEIGIESLSNDVLDKLNKNQSVHDSEKAIKLMQKHGMTPLFTMMSMTPGETIDTFSTMRDFILSRIPNYETLEHMDFNHLYLAGLFMTPHPGTPFADVAIKHGVTVEPKWEHYHYKSLNFIPHSLLNDVPQLSGCAINHQTALLWQESCHTLLWSHYPDPVPPIERRDASLIGFLDKFVANVDEVKTVGEIAMSLSKELGMAEAKALRLTALGCLFLGQYGIIKSLDTATKKKKAEGAPIPAPR